MKKGIFTGFFRLSAAIFLAVFLAPTALRADILVLYGGVSKLSGASWGQWPFATDKYISYEPDPVSVTKIEGMLCESKLGLTLGVNMELDDNVVGKAAKTATQLGVGNIYLRYQTGTLSGRASWSAAAAPGQVFPYKFKEDYAHIDAMIWFKKFMGPIPGYIGFGYTSMALPAEVKTLKTYSDLTKQRYAVPFFEPRHTGRYYSFIFGFDTFASSMLYPDSLKEFEFPLGLSIFFTASDRFGFGESLLSEQGLTAARALNPGLEPVTDRFTGAYVENESSIGLRWRGKLGKFYVAAGLGYELSFYSITNFGGAAQKPGDLGFDVSPNIMRHGPVTRFYVRW